MAKHEQMAQGDAARTMLILRENLVTLLCYIFRNNSA